MSELAHIDTDRLISKILERYPKEPSSLISVLQDFQEECHYLPREILDRAGEALGTSRARVYHVATFFKAFSLVPRGKHIISICRGTACHVKGAEKIDNILRAELGVDDGQTTRDGLFTVQSVRCLGCCSLAPVIMIGRKAYGDLKANSIHKILDHYRSEGEGL